ncbi:MAG: hypothetical protein FJX77_03605 [Armatimonadetes bacterium]|nr:hypothetical protein [Armatimonadota bacterium]
MSTLASAAPPDPDPAVRLATIRALRDSGDPAAPLALGKFLTDSDPAVRKLAATALRALRWEPATAAEHVALAVADGEWSQVRALGTAAVPALCAWLRRPGDSVLPFVLELLVELRDPRAVPPLCRGLKGRDAAVRERFIQALAAFGTRAVRPLIGQLSSDSGPAREGAARALCLIRDPGAVPSLAAGLADPDQCVREVLIEALRAQGKAAVPELRRRLQHAHPLVREGAIRALEGADDPRLVEPLCARLADDYWGVRESAARAVAPFRDRCARKPLCRLLQDPIALVRTAAARALGELEDEGAVEALSLSLMDDCSETRRAAAGALGRIGREPALRALEHRLRRGPNYETIPEVREAIRTAIRWIEEQSRPRASLPIPGTPAAPEREHLPIPGNPVSAALPGDEQGAGASPKAPTVSLWQRWFQR